MSRRGDVKQERKVRETVSIPRPGTAGTTTAPAQSYAPAKTSAPPADDDYDDDFEAYDDDFEEDEEPAPKPVAAVTKAPAKPSAAHKPVPGMKPGGRMFDPAMKGSSGNEDMDSLRQSMQSENMAAMESRKYAAKADHNDDHYRGSPSPLYGSKPVKSTDHSPVPDSNNSPDGRPQATSKSRRTKKFASMDIADDGFSFGPRETRLKKLRESNIMELRVDSFSNFNLAPTSKYDTYQRQLRGRFALLYLCDVVD